MEEDPSRARPNPIHRDLCSLSLWQSDYHLGCDLTAAAGWELEPSHWPRRLQRLQLRQSSGNLSLRLRLLFGLER